MENDKYKIKLDEKVKFCMNILHAFYEIKGIQKATTMTKHDSTFIILADTQTKK